MAKSLVHVNRVVFRSIEEIVCLLKPVLSPSSICDKFYDSISLCLSHFLDNAELSK